MAGVPHLTVSSLYSWVDVAKAISTAGMTPFEVTIAQTVPAMFRFVRAMAKTRAKVSSSAPGDKPGGDLHFIVWLNPMNVPLFESFCEPKGFQFIAAEAIKVNGDVDTTKRPR